MLDEEDIANCYFVPLTTMKRVIDIVDNRSLTKDRRCKRHLLHLQNSRLIVYRDLRQTKWRTIYQMALSQAIHSHDWDKLLFLLKKSPIWEHADPLINRLDHLPLYIRALTILLMYHPYSKKHNLLDDYLHMVLSCRSDIVKKSVMKVLLMLPEKMS